MQCDYFDAGVCRSCTHMGTAYADQLTEKDRRVRSVLLDVTPRTRWHAPVSGPESGFRNKAKLAVGGTADDPTLGILDRSGNGIDLQSCGLYEPALAAAFEPLAEFVRAAGLTPYSLQTRRGELKYLIVTASPSGELMVRFVLRSKALLARIESRFPMLQRTLPTMRVASVNLHPEHKAVLEGEVEFVLPGEESLQMPVNDVELLVGPRSFFQTNTVVAAALYRQAVDWLPRSSETVWDLYCGVGGFALHAAAPERSVYGVEISDDAIRRARAAADGVAGVHFDVGDAFAGVQRLPRPDTVIVNPPRRGIGADLCAQLEHLRPTTIIYSSCNPASLHKDLAALPSYDATDARLFDMFPQTDHAEVLVALARDGRP